MAVWEQLEARMRELHDLSSALKLLEWDQHVWMPPAAGGSRAQGSATLQGIAHARIPDPELGELLDRAATDPSLDEDQAASVSLLKRDRDKATKVPESLVRELAELETLAFQAWAEARPANDFKILEPHLTRVVELKKEGADAIGWEAERYDALIDDFGPAMTTAEVEVLFNELVPALKPVSDRILDSAGQRPAFLSATYEIDRQESFCTWLVGVLGFDMSTGRFDVSPHPFTVHIG